MRIILLLLAALAAAPVIGQKMLPAAEWCAKGKQLFAAPPPNAPPDTRSDSVDIRLTVLHLDVSDFATQEITGRARLDFSAKVNGVSEIRLDLLGMTMDSVQSNLDPIWTYDGSLLRISWSAPMNMDELAQVDIHYHGKPAQDASGWGGFYWQGEYAYNLGVGFAADPHNFGRAWFPCFDNFVERCRFEFYIGSPAGRPAFCNGILLDETPLPDAKIERHWRMDAPIPSYLAGVAVGPFTIVR